MSTLVLLFHAVNCNIIAGEINFIIID